MLLFSNYREYFICIIFSVERTTIPNIILFIVSPFTYMMIYTIIHAPRAVIGMIYIPVSLSCLANSPAPTSTAKNAGS